MQYFEALGRTLHFGQAADLMHVSQPAISSQIALMESQAGTRLVERSRSGVVLTEDGKKLLPKVRRILRDVEAAQADLGAHRGILTGTLHVGIIPTVAPYILPHIIPVLRQSYPELSLKVRETITETLVRDVQTGELDAIIAALPIKATNLRNMTLLKDRFFMALSSNDLDVLVSPLSPDHVEAEKLLLLEDGHCLRDQALAVCPSVSEKRLVNFGATSMATLLQMVAHNMGQTLLPEIAIRAETARNPEIVVVPFGTDIPSRTIALFWRATSDRRADMNAFGEAVRETMTKVLTESCTS